MTLVMTLIMTLVVLTLGRTLIMMFYFANVDSAGSDVLR